jgi:hypothetical protein
MEISCPEGCQKDDNKNGILNSKIVENGDNFSITKQDILMLSAMAILSLMAALDGTSISVALPVFHPALSIIKHFYL